MDVDPKAVKLETIIGNYTQSDFVRCGLSTCHTKHGKGYLVKRERVNRRRYQTHAEARADIFNYIECFYNPRRRRKLEALKHKKSNLT